MTRSTGNSPCRRRWPVTLLWLAALALVPAPSVAAEPPPVDVPAVATEPAQTVAVLVAAEPPPPPSLVAIEPPPPRPPPPPVLVPNLPGLGLPPAGPEGAGGSPDRPGGGASGRDPKGDRVGPGRDEKTKREPGPPGGERGGGPAEQPRPKKEAPPNNDSASGGRGDQVAGRPHDPGRGGAGGGNATKKEGSRGDSPRPKSHPPHPPHRGHRGDSDSGDKARPGGREDRDHDGRPKGKHRDGGWRHKDDRRRHKSRDDDERRSGRSKKRDGRRGERDDDRSKGEASPQRLASVTTASNGVFVSNDGVQRRIRRPGQLTPLATVRIAGRMTRRGARLSLLSVRAPSSALVSIACRGRDCPARVQTRTVAASTGQSSASMRFRRFQRHLRGGTLIEVSVTKQDMVGKFTRFVIRAGRAPLRADMCIAPGASRPSSCS